MTRSDISRKIGILLVAFIFTGSAGKLIIAQQSDDLNSWSDLISFRSTVDTRRTLESRGRQWHDHPIEKATGPINLDYYSVKITSLPKGFATPEDLLASIRKNFNSFVDTTIADFQPYSPDDQLKWISSNPLNSVISINLNRPRWLLNPDDGSVVVSRITPQSWTFSTIYTPGDRAHPVSGNREFGIKREPDGSYTFYTRGADRMTRLSDRVLSEYAFKTADQLWRSFQKGIVKFVNEHHGVAMTEEVISARHDWEKVRHKYYSPDVKNRQSATNESDPIPKNKPNPNEVTLMDQNSRVISEVAPQNQLSSNMPFDPSSLSAKEREAWERNQMIIAQETLRTRTRRSSGSTSSLGLDPIWYDRWHNQGDRAFDSAPEMKELFYKTYPQLDQSRYRDIARYRSPANEVDQDLAAGTLSVELAPQRPSTDNRTVVGTAMSAFTFDPSLLSPQERDGWERNQAKVRSETTKPLPPGYSTNTSNGDSGYERTESSAYRLRLARQELQRHLNNPRQLDAEFQQRMRDLGIRVVNPSNSVRNGTAQITGVARAGYSMADLQVVNKTDDWLAFDFSQSYLVPANLNSGSQRLGLVSVLEEGASRSAEPIAPFGLRDAEASVDGDRPVMFLRVRFGLPAARFAGSVNKRQSGVSSLTDNTESQALALKHWVIVAPRSRAVISYHTVCLDHARGIPRQDEEFKLSDRPLPLQLQQLLVAASLAGDVPQARVWKMINDAQIKWYDPRVPRSIPTFDLAQMPMLLKDFDGDFVNSGGTLIESYFTQGRRKVEQQDLGGALFQFQQAYKLSPDSPTLNFNLSLLYESQNQIIPAISHARTYLQRAPDALNRVEVESRIADLEDELARHPRSQQNPADCREIFDWAQREQEAAKKSGIIARRQAIMEILITSQKGDCENSRILTASYRQRYQ